MASLEDNCSARRCPICGNPTNINSEVFPFCTRRCQLVDLNHWLEGRYTVTGPMEAQETDTKPEIHNSTITPVDLRAKKDTANLRGLK